MGQIDFQIKGLTVHDRRRWKKATESGGTVALIPGLPAISLKLIGWILITVAVAYVLAPINPTAQIGDRAVSAKAVLVMNDRSGSMRGQDLQAKLAALIATLKASNMKVVTDSARGFGVADKGAWDNLLHELQDALKAYPDIDAVYVFSDFTKDFEFAVDGDDQAGYQIFHELLNKYQLRLYLGTVKDPPRRQMVEIAIASGGGMIENR